MPYLVVSYAVYALASIGLTVWLARTLSRHGAVFLEDVWPDKPQLAAAVNRLLVVGFYMLNLGWAFLNLRARSVAGPVEAIEVLAGKLGGLLLVLGVLHFLNLFVFERIRRRAERDALPEPEWPPRAVVWPQAPAAGWAPPAPQ